MADPAITDERLDNRRAKVKVSKTFAVIQHLFSLSRKKVLDLGCGYGEYLALCGAGSLGVTTAPVEAEYGRLQGLDVRLGNAEQLDRLGLTGGFDIIWANNLLEHLLSPHAFLISLKPLAGEQTRLILGVPVRPRLGFLANFYRWRGYLASNHLNFFTLDTLRLTIERAGWRVLQISPFISRSKIVNRLGFFFSPHVYVVAENNPNFVYPPKKIAEWANEPFYQNLLNITNTEI